LNKSLNWNQKNRLREIFSTLDLNLIIKALGPHPHYGPEGYPVEALLRSLVAKQIEGIPTITQLVERLRCDPLSGTTAAFWHTGMCLVKPPLADY